MADASNPHLPRPGPAAAAQDIPDQPGDRSPTLLEQATTDEPSAAPGHPRLLVGLPLEAMPPQELDAGLAIDDEAGAGAPDLAEARIAPADPSPSALPGPTDTGIVFDPASRPRASLMHLAAGHPLPTPRRIEARSKKTEAEYAARVKSLYRASERARTVDPQSPALVSPIEVTADLIESASGPEPQRSLASWGLYRAAMLWHLAANRHLNQAYEAAYDMLAATKKPPGATRTTGAGPGRTKKSIPERDLAELINTLGSMRQNANWGVRTQYWIQAGIATGVRINEWAETTWVDRERRLLQVPTSKRKQTKPAYQMLRETTGAATVHDLDQDNLPPGLAHNEDSRWRIVPVAEEDVMCVDAHINSLQAELQRHMAEGLSREAAMKRYYDMARKTMSLACKRAWLGRKSYSLYAARSQFAANAKASMPLTAVAGMMGQTSTRKAMSNYAPRSAAHKRGGPMGDVLVQREDHDAPQDMTDSPQDLAPDS